MVVGEQAHPVIVAVRVLGGVAAQQVGLGVTGDPLLPEPSPEPLPAPEPLPDPLTQHGC